MENEPDEFTDIDQMSDIMTNLDSIMTDDLLTDFTSLEEDNEIIYDVPLKKIIKTPKTFRERLADDPDFKQRCKDRLNRRVICNICEIELSRSSVHVHNRTKKHLELRQLKLDAEARAHLKYDIITELEYIKKTLLK